MNCSGRATSLFFDISGVCNAKCIYCAQRRLKVNKSYGKLMKPSLFAEILNYLIYIDIIDKNRVRNIPLYSWGEPFLNPEIDEFISILKTKGFKADLSSNFIIEPKINVNSLKNLNCITFSLSGFTQRSYGKIHGADLKKTLTNFELLYTKLRRVSPKTKILIGWHRYRFNEIEFWDALRYFNRPGVHFRPVVAYVNDLPEFVDFITNRIDPERKKQISEDLFVEHILKMLEYHKARSKGYQCPGSSSLVIDEEGRLLLCCGVTRIDSKHVLGNILEMTADEIIDNKNSDKLCDVCISSGLARWFYTPECESGLELKWPAGGGSDRLKFWLKCNLSMSKAAWILKQSPLGDEVVRMTKNWLERF